MSTNTNSEESGLGPQNAAGAFVGGYAAITAFAYTSLSFTWLIAAGLAGVVVGYYHREIYRSVRQKITRVPADDAIPKNKPGQRKIFGLNWAIRMMIVRSITISIILPILLTLSVWSLLVVLSPSELPTYLHLPFFWLTTVWIAFSLCFVFSFSVYWYEGKQGTDLFLLGDNKHLSFWKRYEIAERLHVTYQKGWPHTLALYSFKCVVTQLKITAWVMLFAGGLLASFIIAAVSMVLLAILAVFLTAMFMAHFTLNRSEHTTCPDSDPSSFRLNRFPTWLPSHLACDDSGNCYHQRDNVCPSNTVCEAYPDQCQNHSPG